MNDGKGLSLVTLIDLDYQLVAELRRRVLRRKLSVSCIDSPNIDDKLSRIQRIFGHKLQIRMCAKTAKKYLSSTGQYFN